MEDFEVLREEQAAGEQAAVLDPREQAIADIEAEQARYVAALKAIRRGAIAARENGPGRNWCREGLNDWLRRYGLLSMRHNESELDELHPHGIEIEDYTAAGLAKKLARLRRRNDERLANVRRSAIGHARNGDVTFEYANSVLESAGLQPFVHRTRTGFHLEGRFYAPTDVTPAREVVEEKLRAAFEQAVADLAPEGAEVRTSVRVSAAEIRED